MKIGEQIKKVHQFKTFVGRAVRYTSDPVVWTLSRLLFVSHPSASITEIIDFCTVSRREKQKSEGSSAEPVSDLA